MPGWVCQPEKPFGSYVTLNVATSAASLVWNLSRSVLMCVASASVPIVGAVGCWPDGGVASAKAARPAATAPTAMNGTTWLMMARMTSLLPCGGHDQPTVGPRPLHANRAIPGTAPCAD